MREILTPFFCLPTGSTPTGLQPAHFSSHLVISHHLPLSQSVRITRTYRMEHTQSLVDQLSIVLPSSSRFVGTSLKRH